jgi:ParB-like chromosome segregation protein Spo0J
MPKATKQETASNLATMPAPANGVTRPVPIAAIIPSPTNPRKFIADKELAELAENIKQNGLIEPILVRPMRQIKVTYEDGTTRTQVIGSLHVEEFCARVIEQAEVIEAQPFGPEVYEIAAGERRWRASSKNLADQQEADNAADNPDAPPIVWEIAATVRELTDEQMLSIQVSENLQREDLSPLEWAAAYAAMVEVERLRGEEGAVHRVAVKLAKSDSVVYQVLQLAKLVPEAQTALRRGYITKNHAIDCARLEEYEQLNYLCAALLDAIGYTMFPGDDHDELRLYLAADNAEPAAIASVRTMKEWCKRLHPTEDAETGHELFSPEDAGDLRQPSEDTEGERDEPDEDDEEEADEADQVRTAAPIDKPAQAEPTADQVKEREIRAQVIRQAAVKILANATKAAKAKGQTIAADDLLLIAERVFEYLPAELRQTIAAAMRWEQAGAIYSRLAELGPELRGQFLILCALARSLTTLQPDVTFTAFAGRYKVTLADIENEIRNPQAKQPAKAAKKPSTKKQPTSAKAAKAPRKGTKTAGNRNPLGKKAEAKLAKVKKAAKPAAGKKAGRR